MYSEDSIQYALETTQVLHEPDRRIDTFGSTSFHFHIISELMDDVRQVRVRTGEIHAQRPTILRPEPYADLEFEGFGEGASSFAQWMKERMSQTNAALLQYGFSFKKSDVTESLVHDSLAIVTERVLAEIRTANSPLTAVILGVDDTWEICLLKFTLEMIQKSHKINLFDFKRRGLL